MFPAAQTVHCSRTPAQGWLFFCSLCYIHIYGVYSVQEKSQRVNKSKFVENRVSLTVGLREHSVCVCVCVCVCGAEA